MKAQPFNSVTTTTTPKKEKIVLINFKGHIMKMTDLEFKKFQEDLKEWDN